MSKSEPQTIPQSTPTAKHKHIGIRTHHRISVPNHRYSRKRARVYLQLFPFLAPWLGSPRPSRALSADASSLHHDLALQMADLGLHGSGAGVGLG